MSVLGAAVVGLGVGERHARSYAADPRCRLTWVCDLDADRAGRVAHETGAVAGSFEQILKDPETSVVSIASYDDAHADQVAAALLAGKHVFVEKPIVRSLEELRRVRDAWERSGRRRLASNLVLRGAPLYRRLKEEVDGGRMGRLYAFDGDYLYGRVQKITEGWRKDVEDYSVFLGGGIHLADLMLWITGERPATVTAAGSRLATAGTAFRYDDFLAATFRFPSGMIARITANFGCVHRHQHVVRAFGTRATFLYDDQGARLHETREPDVAPRRLDEAPEPASKDVLIPEFVTSVLEARDNGPAAEREFDLIRVCLAADDAARSGRQVEI